MEWVKAVALRTANRLAAYAGLPITTSSRRGGWWPLIREPYTGAWQRNVEWDADTVLSYAPVFACVTLIAADIAKMRLHLVEQTEDGIWHETTNPAYSPVLRRPNRYQTINKFVEQWMTSKLIHGNTYVLKQRDNRGVVAALYVLDPTRVVPLVTTDGAVYYDLRRDDLSGLTSDLYASDLPLIVPASEIIHDTCSCIFHPLIGVSPIYACGLPALQGLKIQDNQTRFFGNGSQPGGVLTAPGAITEETAARLKAYWESEFSGGNVGRIAVVGDGLKYEPMSMNAVDAQLIDQLSWTATMVCTAFRVPPFMIGIGDRPAYASAELMTQQYYSQCLQAHVTNFEAALDEGLATGPNLGTEFDVDDLIWMDTATRGKAAHDAIGAGALSPNEARAKYYGVGRVPGGDTPYMQQQNYSLAALARRDEGDPFAPALPSSVMTEAEWSSRDVEHFLSRFAELTRAA